MKTKLLYLLSIFTTIIFAQEQLYIEYELSSYYLDKSGKTFDGMSAIPTTFSLLLGEKESQYEYIEKIVNQQGAMGYFKA